MLVHMIDFPFFLSAGNRVIYSSIPIILKADTGFYCYTLVTVRLPVGGDQILVHVRGYDECLSVVNNKRFKRVGGTLHNYLPAFQQRQYVNRITCRVANSFRESM